MKNTKNTFAVSLVNWYQASARDLPWRKTTDPYKIWVSEVMLQQTTVNAVIPYYLEWIKQFPDIQSVANSSIEKVLKAWQGLGYYSRARNLYAAATVVCKEFGGIFPSEKDRLRKLPGMGPYTTGAVLSIAFDQREPIVDANVRRVVMRQLKLSGKADTAHDARIIEFLLTIMPSKNNRIFNQALMELGALICRSKNPSCLACPVRCFCQANKHGVVDIIPEPKKVMIKNVSAVIAVIKKGQKYFMQKRPSKGLFADLWEFPGGKIEPGEKAEQALVREVQEELGINVALEEKMPKVVQYYTQFKATLTVWLCRPLTLPAVDQTHRWVGKEDFRNYAVSSGTAKIIEFLGGGRMHSGQ